MITLPAHIERIFAQNDGSWNAKISFGEMKSEDIAELAKANGKVVMIHITLANEFTEKEKEVIEAAKIEVNKIDSFDSLEDKKKAFIGFYIDNMGIVLRACKRAGITRATFYNWMNSDEAFASEIRAVDKSDLWRDKAEDSAADLLEERNAPMTIFALKTQAQWREKEAEKDTFPENIKIEIVNQPTKQ